MDYLVKNRIQREKNLIRLYRIFQKNDLLALKDLFQAFFASIPYEWYRKSEIQNYEGYYASIFYAYFCALGLEVRVEDATNHGRLDMTVFFEDRCYLFEFKVVELEPQGGALKQLKEKRYFEKYLEQCEKIFLIGVEFSKRKRNIVSFEVEEVSQAKMES